MTRRKSLRKKLAYWQRTKNIPITNCVKCKSTNIDEMIVTFKDGTLHKKVFCGDCGKHLKFRRIKRKIKNVYSDRQELIEALGFDTYQKYLDSPLWKGIRLKALSRDNHKCQLCYRPAQCVHHKKYSSGALSGNSIHDLISLCNKCHTKVEFKSGARRNLDGCQKKTLREVRKQNRKQDTNLCRQCRVNKRTTKRSKDGKRYKHCWPCFIVLSQNGWVWPY